jgi:hypothetical protein
MASGGHRVWGHRVDSATLAPGISELVDRTSTIGTDELSVYRTIGQHFDGGHHKVNHSEGEYSRDGVTTNTAESFFALMKRGHYGVFHQLSKKHLHRYCDELSFRWNWRKLDDAERRMTAMRQVEGKRLMYKMPVVKSA